jgi:hypothetical protein
MNSRRPAKYAIKIRSACDLWKSHFIFNPNSERLEVTNIIHCLTYQDIPNNLQKFVPAARKFQKLEFKRFLDSPDLQQESFHVHF